MIYDFELPNEMTLYKAMFHGLIAQKSSRLIENSSSCHARIIISELIASARVSILVFCDHLSPDVWSDDSVVASMRAAMSRGVSVGVVTQSMAEPSEMLALLNEGKAYKGSVGVKVDIPNFVVIDETAFRIEIDEKCRQGAACANDETTSRYLKNSYVKLLDMLNCGLNAQKTS